jgi:hypothetical protein
MFFGFFGVVGNSVGDVIDSSLRILASKEVDHESADRNDYRVRV